MFSHRVVRCKAHHEVGAASMGERLARSLLALGVAGCSSGGGASGAGVVGGADAGAGADAAGVGAPVTDATIGEASSAAVPRDAGLPEVGSLCVPAPPSAPPCGAALCGNGTIDTCTTGDQFMPTVSEQCDGLASIAASHQTCASLGFADGGTLGCTAQCSLDTTRCDRCAHGSPHVIGCTGLPDPTLGGFPLATSSDEIMVAGVYATSTGRAVRLVRFAGDLSLLWVSGCFGPGNVASVAIARSPSGYILAVGTEQPNTLQIYPLATDGSIRGSVRTVAVQSDAGTAYVPAVSPLLASRMVGGGSPGGGPLLVYTATLPYAPLGSNGETRTAVLLKDDGADETTPVNLPGTFVFSDRASGVFVGDGFLYAQEQEPYPSTAGVWHIGLDGALGAGQTPSGTVRIAESPSLAWTGTAAYFTFASYDPMGLSAPYLAWMRLSVTGAPLGPATPLAGSNDQPYSAALAVGEDLLALTTGTSGAGVYAQRFAADGGLVDTPFAVGTLDGVLGNQSRLALLGSVPIAAWSDGVLSLARLSP